MREVIEAELGRPMGEVISSFIWLATLTLALALALTLILTLTLTLTLTLPRYSAPSPGHRSAAPPSARRTERH